MKEFDKIFVTWRKGVGQDRCAIGVLEKNDLGKHTFQYLSEAFKMENDGFKPYTEFQDLNTIYNGNVAEIFGQRLMRPNRADVSSFYSFWDVDISKIDDKFYLLGKTQGLVPTDNFEFLADYIPFKGLSFVTELAGLSTNRLERGSLIVNDILRFEKQYDNAFDSNAIKVFKDSLFIGYIKKYHNGFFWKSGVEDLVLKVKALEQNGVIKKVFVEVVM